MARHDPSGQRQRRTDRRDYVLVAAVCVATFGVGAWFGVFDDPARGTADALRLSGGQLEAMLTIALAGVGSILLLRKREARRERGRLHAVEEDYRTLVEQVPAITYSWDPTSPTGTQKPLYVSPQVEQILGYSPEEWMASERFWIECVHPDDRDRVVAASDESDRAGTPFVLEYRMLTKDGRTIWLHDESRVGGDSNSRPARAQGVMYDITERKLVEQRLTDAEGRYRTLVERVPAVTYIEDAATGDTLYISPQIYEMFGYTPEEWLADPKLWEDRLHPEDRDWVMEANAADTGDTWNADYRTVHRDGRTVWLHNDTVLIRDEAGAPLYWQGVAFDITERKEAEAQLRRAEERYRTLIEELPAVVYVDAVEDWAALYISPQYERVLGFSPEQRVADPDLWKRQVHPEDLARVVAESDHAGHTGGPLDIEYRWTRPDGTTIWVHDHATQVLGPDGALVWQGVLTDITEAKRSAESLDRRDQILQAAGQAAERFLRASSWIACIDEVLACVGAADGASRAFVFRNDLPADGRLTMTKIFEWNAPGIAPTLDLAYNSGYPYDDGYEDWEELLRGGKAVQGRLQDVPARQQEWLEAEDVHSNLAVPIFVGGTWWGFIGIDECRADRRWELAEIDALRVVASTLGAAIERANAAEQLTETENRYQVLIEQLPTATFMTTAEPPRQTLYMSPQIESILGYAAAGWTSEIWERSLHPEDRDRVLTEDERTNGSGDRYSIEYRLRAHDGRWVWVHDEAQQILDASGKPAYWQGVRADITERKAAEEQLREAEERYRAIVEHVPAVIYVDSLDESMRTIYISPQVFDLTGYTPEEWIADPELWLKVTPAEDRAVLRDGYLRSVSDGAPWEADYRITTRNGRAIWVHDETTIITDEAGTPRFLQGVIFDVTERKLAEQALRDSEQREREAAERLRALDEMKNTFLAAVSHELRSPLTSILGLSLTLERTREMAEHDRSDLLERLSANARKLDRLLKDLLDIDRLNRGIVEPQYRITDVGALSRRAIESLDALADRAVQIDVDSVILSVDPAKVERIVENLVMNAVRHTASDRTIWLQVRAAPDGVLICVEDDGPGVPEALREVIFEPFRQGPTASPHAPGTGIGLSLVARFAELHGGRAWVDERPGGGASFKVLLPAGRSDIVDERPASTSATGSTASHS